MSINYRNGQLLSDEKYLSISRPCQAKTVWGLSLAVCADHLLSELIHNDLALQILDARKQQKQQKD